MTSALPPLISRPPPLHPNWLAHEKKTELSKFNAPVPPLSIEQRRLEYSKACIQRNNEILALPENAVLTSEISCEDWVIPSLYPSTSTSSGGVGVRTYRKVVNNDENDGDSRDKVDSPAWDEEEREEVEMIYYHGGGLLVGDLDSEDLSCRRICHGLGYTVHSIAYTLLPRPQPSLPPLHPSISNQPLKDAFTAFNYLVSPPSSPSLSIPKTNNPKSFILVGSSSGGQLATQLCLLARDLSPIFLSQTKGIFLRCPVTVDASSKSGLSGVDARWRGQHLSYSEAFETSLLRLPFSSVVGSSGMYHGVGGKETGMVYEIAVQTYKSQISCPDINPEQKAQALEIFSKTANIPLPLTWGNFKGFPKMGIQLCTNDIYYSDGAILAAVIRQAGSEVRSWVWEGWPHTFWLKGPGLDEAMGADGEMIRGLRWLDGRGD